MIISDFEAQLTRAQRVVFCTLLTGNYVTTKRLVAILYEDHEDGGPLFAEQVVHDTLSRLRRKLKGVGIEIETSPRRLGYRIHGVSLTKARELVRESIPPSEACPHCGTVRVLDS